MLLISPSLVSLPRFITNPVIVQPDVYLEENEDDKDKDLCKREHQDENFAEDGSKMNDLIEYYEETSYLAEGLRMGI